ncbi:MAG: cyanophycinase [Proteobacteria bacterium]|nr:cyanophycinase [Pseudomonadota bacterium]
MIDRCLSRLLAGIALCVAAWLPAAASAAPHSYEYFRIGEIHAATPAETRAGLMLMGGGENVQPAFEWLVAHAGHGHIVILRASGDDDLQNYIYHDIGGVKSVQTLIFHDRSQSSDPRVLDVIRHADGIFIAGGDQANYVHFWKGTPVNALLDAHLHAGKPIGGTSAGLAILGRYSYGALDGGSVTSPEALADPMGPAMTLLDDFLHLPPLYESQVITDTHFDTRERLGRLLAFIANLAKTRHVAAIVGLGVDENTALCVDEDGRARFFSGHPGGHADLVVQTKLKEVEAQGGRAALDAYLADRVKAGKPLDLDGYSVIAIGTDSTLRFPSLQVDRPASRETIDVRDGKLVRRAIH